MTRHWQGWNRWNIEKTWDERAVEHPKARHRSPGNVSTTCIHVAIGVALRLLKS